MQDDNHLDLDVRKGEKEKWADLIHILMPNDGLEIKGKEDVVKKDSENIKYN